MRLLRVRRRLKPGSPEWWASYRGELGALGRQLFELRQEVLEHPEKWWLHVELDALVKRIRRTG